MGFGRARSGGVVGVAAALIALSLADPRLRAEPESRGEGRIAFTLGESGADLPSQLAVMGADGKNRVTRRSKAGVRAWPRRGQAV
jgi:hypothetical protein